MNPTTTNEKAVAISSLDWFDFQIKIRGNGEWYATTSVEIKDGSVLKGCMGNGYSPEDAVDELWNNMTKLQPHEYLVVHATNTGTKRAAYRWNGFMWAPVDEPSWRDMP